MITKEIREEIETTYFSSEFQDLDRYDKEEIVRARLEEVKDKISELQFEKADLQRYLGQRD